MRILYVCNEYPPAPHGGIGTFVRTLAQQLVALGHTVTVVGLDHVVRSPIKQTDDGVTVWRFPYRYTWMKAPKIGRYSLSPAFILQRMHLSHRVARIARDCKADLVESYDWSGPLWTKPQVPLVVRFHGANTAHQVYEGLKPSTLLRFLERRNVAMADALVSVSRHIGEITLRALALPHRPFRVIYNGVDTEMFRPQAPSNERAEVLYVGTVSRRKGAVELLRCFPIVAQKVPNVQLTFVGRLPAKGDDKRLLDETLASLPEGARQAVKFVGLVPHADLPARYSRAGAAVFPSHAEAFGLTIVEAMACGAAVVVTSKASGPEIVEDGVSGLLADPSDLRQMAGAITRVLQEQQVRETLRRNARARAVECFDVRKLAQQNVEFYQEVLDDFPG